MKEAWELFLHGGFVMWPLLVALIIAVAIAIERIAYYRQLKREMFALNDALEESEMNWQSLLTSLESKYTANIHLDVDAVLLGEIAFAPFHVTNVFGFNVAVGIVTGLIILIINY